MKSAYRPQTFVTLTGESRPETLANAFARIVGCMERLLVEKLPRAAALPAWIEAWWLGETERGVLGIAFPLGDASQNLPSLFAPPFDQKPADPACLANRIQRALNRPLDVLRQGKSGRVDLDYVRETIAEMTACWRELYSVVLSVGMAPTARVESKGPLVRDDGPDGNDAFWWKGRRIDAQPKSVQLLIHVWNEGGNAQIENAMDKVWGHFASDAAINNAISRLNSKLPSDFGKSLHRRGANLILE